MPKIKVANQSTSCRLISHSNCCYHCPLDVPLLFHQSAPLLPFHVSHPVWKKKMNLVGETGSHECKTDWYPSEPLFDTSSSVSPSVGWFACSSLICQSLSHSLNNPSWYWFHSLKNWRRKKTNCSIERPSIYMLNGRKKYALAAARREVETEYKQESRNKLFNWTAK